MTVSTLFDSIEMGNTSEGLSIPDHVTVMSGESLLIGGDMVSNRNYYIIDDLPQEVAHLREGAIVIIKPIDGIPCTYAALRVTVGFNKTCEATGDPVRYEYISNTTVVTEGVTSRMRVIPPNQPRCTGRLSRSSPRYHCSIATNVRPSSLRAGRKWHVIGPTDIGRPIGPRLPPLTRLCEVASTWYR